jgi:hypothetical protein
MAAGTKRYYAHLHLQPAATVLQALPDVRACNLAAQTLSGEVSQLELQLKYKKAELKQSQEERTKLQVSPATLFAGLVNTCWSE